MLKDNNINRVIFYAPIGNLIKGFQSGGAEAGCRKTIEVLNKARYKVLLLEKPAKSSNAKFPIIGLMVRLISIWIRSVILFIKNKNSVLHVAGFYRDQIYFEWILVKTAKLFGIKAIYEIRNGGMIEEYTEGSSTYKFFMKSVLLNSKLVLCQGYDYVTFLKKFFKKDSVYYPNYIMDDFIGNDNSEREFQDTLKLIYFGRVVPDKNVDFIIDVCKHLKNANLSVHLDIIGGYEDNYYALLNDKIVNYNLIKNVKFHGKMDFKDICRLLKSSHFFVFPSKEKREGHSNALTEAMGCGVVPIVSKAGFNESIVGNSELVMQDFKPELYAFKIEEIWNRKQWKFNSNKVNDRILNNYTESIVKKSLLQAYQDLGTV